MLDPLVPYERLNRNTYAILQAAALRAATNDIPSNLSGGSDRVVSWYDYEDVLKRLLDDNSAYREADGQ